MKFLIFYVIGYCIALLSIFISNKYTNGKKLPILSLNTALSVSFLSWIFVIFHISLYTLNYLKSGFIKVWNYINSIQFREKWKKIDAWFQKKSVFRK